MEVAISHASTYLPVIPGAGLGQPLLLLLLAAHVYACSSLARVASSLLAPSNLHARQLRFAKLLHAHRRQRVRGAEDASLQAFLVGAHERGQGVRHAARQLRLVLLRCRGSAAPTRRSLTRALRQQRSLLLPQRLRVQRAEHGGVDAQRPRLALILLSVTVTVPHACAASQL